MKIFAKKILALGIYSALISASVQAATYEVTEVNSISTNDNTTIIDENDSGESVLIGTGVTDFSVQYQYFSESDYDSIVSNAEASNELFFGIGDIEDEDALRNGNPTDNDEFWVLVYLQSNAGLFSSQQFGDSTVLVNIDGTTEEVVIFDTTFENTGTLTRSTVDTVTGITNNGWIFGSGTAPYLPVTFTDDNNTDDTDDDEIDNYWIRDFDLRAFYSVDKGQTVIPLVPPESTYGGVSVISDMSDSGVAIGYASTDIPDNVTEFLSETSEDCSSPEQLAELPEIVCIDLVLTQNQLTLSDLYSTNAFKWIIGADGTVTSQEALGQLITPHAEDTRGVSSFGQAVNDEGTVVGYADGWFKSNVTSPSKDELRASTYAVVFKDNLVVELYPDHDDHFVSRANDLNNSGISVGYANNGSINEFFYIDTSDIEDMDIVFPESFFEGSASTANSVNEDGFVVGSADFESNIGTRRKHAFMYDINTDTFTDLNDFIDCNSDYTIVDANNINENNEILATAIIKINVTDTDGNNTFDEVGEPIFDEVARAIKLTPIDGEIESCSVEDDSVERQGASFGLFMPLILLLVGFRRKFI